jgi:hypothetical protein
MRGWLAALVLIAGCNRTFATVKRELFRTTVDGVEITVRAELHGWHTAAHMGPEFRTLPARDDFTILRGETAKRGSKDLPMFDTSDLGVRAIDTPATYDAGKATLASLAAVTCPIGHGVAFQVKSEWRALFVLGDRVFESKLDTKATDCATLGPISAESTLPASPGGATTCLALDEAGLRPAAIDCFLRGTRSDLAPVKPLPKDGDTRELVAEIVKHGDRDALVARFASDATVIDGMIERLATKPPPFEDIVIARERMLAIDAAHALPRFIDRVATECATTTCSDDVVRYGELAIGWNGTAFVTPDACAKGMSFARSLASKGDAAAMKRAFFVLRGFFSCLDASVRPLLVSGLAIATSPEQTLSGLDSNCEPFTSNTGREVSSLCESFPRFAGTWLGAHCGPDAIAAATKIARERPRTPFNPRADQVLDGALRVLGTCDKTAFEAAIAHVPETTVAAEDVSKTQLRTAFVK